MLQFQSVEEVKEFSKHHNNLLLVIFQNGVYDLTLFQKYHTGGKDVLQKYNGTRIDYSIFNPSVYNHKRSILRTLDRYICGEVAGLVSTPIIQLISTQRINNHRPKMIRTCSPYQFLEPKQNTYIRKNSKSLLNLKNNNQYENKKQSSPDQKQNQRKFSIQKISSDLISLSQCQLEDQKTSLDKNINKMQMNINPRFITDILLTQQKQTVL